MTTILGLCGSLRRASYNAGLLRAAQAAAPEGTVIEAGSIREVPLYDGDLEAREGLPEPVLALRRALEAAAGLLIVTPEYNNGVPGVLKNAIDWMSRPPGGVALFRGKPVALIGASTGGFGTTLAQTHWLPVLRHLGMRPWFEGRLMVSRVGELCDDRGDLIDEATRVRLEEFVAGFAAFCAKVP